ncbi:hypothetical protein [Acidipila sp. EB88]|uniref:hypothetical protein n=1 Tax=Acidipila sp. EB88 TaxID=2305226 RepID=UPI000F5F18CD|nr:hypothetical protein [Acidipila sp. EB88]RRA48218.1 hypothetical protein D1Y84_07880 [Acidipila sp. EB88]
MASILVNLEHGVEVAATDILTFLTATQSSALQLEPGVIAALGVLLGATETALAEVNQAAATPLNISLDVATFRSLETVWPAIVSFAKAVGIKL